MLSLLGSWESDNNKGDDELDLFSKPATTSRHFLTSFNMYIDAVNNFKGISRRTGETLIPIIREKEAKTKMCMKWTKLYFSRTRQKRKGQVKEYV